MVSSFTAPTIPGKEPCNPKDLTPSFKACNSCSSPLWEGEVELWQGLLPGQRHTDLETEACCKFLSNI